MTKIINEKMTDQVKNFSKTMKNIFINFKSERYLIWAVLPIKESMFLS